MQLKNELIIRSLSGILFVAAVLGAIFASPVTTMILFALLLALVSYEYLRLTIGEGRKWLKAISIATCVLLFLVWCPILLLGSHKVLWVFAIFLLMFIGFLAVFANALFTNNYKGLESSLAALLYTAFPFSCVPMLYFVFSKSGLAASGAWGVAGVLIILWVSDIGAYCVGSLLGQGPRGHKLCPKISPRKSWEGVIGGVVFSLLTGCILNRCGVLMPKTGAGLAMVLVFSFAIAASGVFGDLIESQLKRHCGVKDSSALIPGHGGFLDRFDSALMAWPVALVVYSVMATIFFNHI